MNLHIPVSILLTVVTRTTTENPVLCVLKANQERLRAKQLLYAMLNLIDNCSFEKPRHM